MQASGLLLGQDSQRWTLHQFKLPLLWTHSCQCCYGHSCPYATNPTAMDSADEDTQEACGDNDTASRLLVGHRIHF